MMDKNVDMFPLLLQDNFELPLWVAGIPGAGDWRGGVTATSPFESISFVNLESNLDDSVGVGLNSYLGKFVAIMLNLKYVE